MEMPDAETLGKWLKDPNMRDFAVALIFASFVAYRTATMKGVIGQVSNLVLDRLDKRGPGVIAGIDDRLKKREAYRLAMNKYKRELSEWKARMALGAQAQEYPRPTIDWTEASWLEATIPQERPGPFMEFNAYVYSRGYAPGMEFPPSVRDDYYKEVDHRMKLIVRWDENKAEQLRLYNGYLLKQYILQQQWDEAAAIALDEPAPVRPDAPDRMRYLEEPTADEIAFAGTVGFIIALKPELLTETLKGIGRILQGIGEIVPG